MKQILSTIVVLISASVMGACQAQSAVAARDISSPRIEHIETSAKFLAKSDCMNTSETVTADITDTSGIKQAVLWYRVGADQKYAPAEMSLVKDKYSATVKALDVPGGEYGIWEFYITAEDQAGNKSQTPLDTSVQLLPCVASYIVPHSAAVLWIIRYTRNSNISLEFSPKSLLNYETSGNSGKGVFPARLNRI